MKVTSLVLLSLSAGALAAPIRRAESSSASTDSINGLIPGALKRDAEPQSSLPAVSFEPALTSIRGPEPD